MIVQPADIATGRALTQGFRRLKALCAASLSLTLLTTAAFAQSAVSLAWNASADTTVTGYYLYQGGSSHNYTNVLAVGNVTSATLSNLLTGGTYYFALTAHDAYGLESPFSNEVAYNVPATTQAPAVALTVPASGASYSAPGTLNLAASVTANGHTVTQVQFYNGTALLGSSATAPYGFSWNNVSAGNYSLFARLVYDSGSTLDSAHTSISVTNAASSTGLPGPWQTLDIGAVGASGNAADSNGVFSVTGAGTIGGSVDKFRFVYQALSSDGEIRARIVANDDAPYNWAGVMIRESLTADSSYGLVGLASGNIVRFSARISTGSNSKSSSNWKATPPNIWVRLVRTGNSLNGYKSTDGVNWGKPFAHYNVAMASNIYIGLAVASGTATGLNTGVFDSLTVVP